MATEDEEEDNVQALCCSFQRYLHCSEQVVNSTCGSHTAGFTKQFLDRMSGPLVQQHCQHYEHGSERHVSITCLVFPRLTQVHDDLGGARVQGVEIRSVILVKTLGGEVVNASESVH